MTLYKGLRGAALWLMFVASSLAYATQEATVASPNATIYQKLNGRMQAAQQVSEGQTLKVGDQEKGGWYSVAIPGSSPSQLGWIRAKDVTLGAPGSPRSVRTSTKRTKGTTSKRLSVGISYNVAFVSPTQLQAAAGLAPNPNIGSSLGIEIERSFFTEQFYLGARVDVFLLSGNLPNGNQTGGDLGYTGFAIPISVIGRYDFISGPKFRLGAQAGVGLSPVTTYRATIGTESTTASGLGLFVPMSLEGDIQFGQRIAIMIEAGYRLSSPLSPLTLSGVTIKSDFSALLGGAGLRILF